MGPRKPPIASERAGYSAVELAFSVTIFVVVLLSALAMVDRDTHLSRSSLSIGTVETMAQEMLFELEKELVNGAGETPQAVLDTAFGAGATATLSVDSTSNFPPGSTVIIDWDDASREVVGYATLSADEENFVGLERGLECTQDTDHAFQAPVMWSGLGMVAAQQDPAPPGFDRQAMEPGGPLWYAGQGTGFVYRVPVDPNPGVGSGTNYLDGDDVVWGAVLEGSDPRDCYAALYFQPRTVLDEAATGDDVNRDGDTDDVFDVGQIRRVVWDATDPAAPVQDLGLGPSSVLQERCDYGSDLDGDGMGDPIFLWNPRTRRLHMRMLVVGRSVADVPIVRMVESIIYLRNSPPTSS